MEWISLPWSVQRQERGQRSTFRPLDWTGRGEPRAATLRCPRALCIAVDVSPPLERLEGERCHCHFTLHVQAYQRAGHNKSTPHHFNLYFDSSIEILVDCPNFKWPLALIEPTKTD